MYLRRNQFLVTVSPWGIFKAVLMGLGALTLLIMLFGCKAHAQFYTRTEAGAVYVAPINFTATGFLNGQARLRSGAGYYFGGAAGTYLQPYLKAEGEIGYFRSGFKDVGGDLSGTVRGQIEAFTGYGNLIVAPAFASFTPYIGGGAGVVVSRTRVDQIAGLPIALSQDKASFAVQGLTGLDYALTDRFKLGVRYKYQWVNAATDFNVLGSSVHQSNAVVHALTASLTYRF